MIKELSCEDATMGYFLPYIHIDLYLKEEKVTKKIKSNKYSIRYIKK